MKIRCAFSLSMEYKERLLSGIRACDSGNWRSWIHFVEETEGDKIVKSCCFATALKAQTLSITSSDIPCQQPP